MRPAEDWIKVDTAPPGLFGTNAAESVPALPFCSSTHITTGPAELLLGKTGEDEETGKGIALRSHRRAWEKNGGKAGLGCTLCPGGLHTRVCTERPCALRGVQGAATHRAPAAFGSGSRSLN